MKTLHAIIAVLSIALAGQAIAQTQDIDKELSDLTEKLAKPITERQKTKIAVLDFTDLEGNPKGELGKYVAEQLTVNFVTAKRSFSVLDRANLKKILAEHKLTAQGLVDPENAKKLGQFAGVDVLVLGTIIPKGTKTVSLTAKIVTTDTAEVIGAARAEFINDETVQGLMAIVVQAEAANDDGKDTSAKAPKRRIFGDLEVKSTSVRYLSGDNMSGVVGITMVITNTSASLTYGAAFARHVLSSDMHLTNDRGDQFDVIRLNGIELRDKYSFNGRLTDIPQNSSITVTAQGISRWNGKPGDYRPYHLQIVVFFGVEEKGQYSNIREYNVTTDVK